MVSGLLLGLVMMIAVFAVSFLIVYFINWLLHRHDSHCPSFFQWREWYAYQRALQERQLKQLEEERRTVARSTEPRPDQWEDWETDRLNQVKAEEEAFWQEHIANDRPQPVPPPTWAESRNAYRSDAEALPPEEWCEERDDPTTYGYSEVWEEEWVEEEEEEEED